MMNSQSQKGIDRRVFVNENELTKQLKQWRETRSRKVPQQQNLSDRRMVRVNGQDVVVVTKSRKAQG
jgi:hypothetical protein